MIRTHTSSTNGLGTTTKEANPLFSWLNGTRNASISRVHIKRFSSDFPRSHPFTWLSTLSAFRVFLVFCHSYDSLPEATIIGCYICTLEHKLLPRQATRGSLWSPTNHFDWYPFVRTFFRSVRDRERQGETERRGKKRNSSHGGFISARRLIVRFGKEKGDDGPFASPKNTDEP